jgi:protein-S-isoprenylcysteine O-methyltransferase Ste14
MDRFKQWASRERSVGVRLATLAGLAVLFVIIFPLALALAAPLVDYRLGLPTIRFGVGNLIVGLALAAPGLALALWSISVQFRVGRGTPAPFMPTTTLVVVPPFTYCRNPMTLGTWAAFLGLAVWIGSISAVGIVLITMLLLVGYIKVVEENELAARFGEPYLEYKRRTPFIIPRLRRQG